jgi:hypothetical protein
MVGSQIANLTPGLSFDHNLCFKYPNGSYKPISDIYILRNFQWYKEPFNPMSFDPCNRLLKNHESIETSTPKVGTHLGVWEFIPWTFLHSWKHETWLPSSLLARTFASPCFGREPKARVATFHQLFKLWNMYYSESCHPILNRKSNIKNYLA